MPDGPDCLDRVYNRRNCSPTAQFRGGDGFIGCLVPIVRGDHKKRARNNRVDQGYDTLLLGHWHQLIQLQRLIVEGRARSEYYRSTARLVLLINEEVGPHRRARPETPGRPHDLVRRRLAGGTSRPWLAGLSVEVRGWRCGVRVSAACGRTQSASSSPNPQGPGMAVL